MLLMKVGTGYISQLLTDEGCSAAGIGERACAPALFMKIQLEISLKGVRHEFGAHAQLLLER